MYIMKLVGSAAVKAFGISLVVGALFMGGYYFVNTTDDAGDHIQNAINQRLEGIDKTVQHTPVVNTPQGDTNQVDPDYEGKDPENNFEDITEADASED